MKSIYKVILLGAVIALGSCSKEAMFGDGSGLTGQITKPGVEVNNAETVYQSAATRSDYDTSNYILDFYKDGSTEVSITDTYSNLGSTIDLQEGKWEIHVRSHEVKGADWDNPYFTGTSDVFEIEANKVKAVGTIKCTFSSIKVTVEFDPKLLNAMTEVSATVTTGEDNSLVFSSTETRAGYFMADGSTTMVVTFSGKVDGKVEEQTQALSSIAVGQWRKITFSMGDDLPQPDQPNGYINPGTSGDSETGTEGTTIVNLSIKVTDEDITNYSLNPGKEEAVDGDTEVPGTLKDSEETENPSQGGSTSDEPGSGTNDPIYFEGNIQNGQTYGTSTFNDSNKATIIVNAVNGIADFVVTIDSPDGGLDADALESVNLAGSFSLVNDTLVNGYSLFDTLSGLELPTGSNVKGKTNLEVDITKFMDLLDMLGDTTNIFVMAITDSQGNTSSLTFTLLGNR